MPDTTTFPPAASGPALVGPGGTGAIDAAKIRVVRAAINNLAAMSTVTVTATFSTAFADANYTWTWSIRTTTSAANDMRVLTATAKSAGSIDVLVQNSTSGGPESGVLEIIAIHD